MQQPIISLFLIIALCNIRKILRHQERLKLNTQQFCLHIILISFLTIDVGFLFFLAIQWDASLSNFEFDKQFMTSHLISLVLQSLIVLYLAYVLVLSSKAVARVQDPLLNQQVSLIVYLQNMQAVRKLQGPSLRTESFQQLKRRNRTLRANSLFTGESESLSPEPEGRDRDFEDLYKRGAMQNMVKQGEAESVWG